MTTRDDSWRARARCAGEPTAIFFDADRRDEAAAMCRQCPVILACRAAGKNEAGWWGGALGGAQEALSDRRRLSRAGARRLDELVQRYGTG